MQNTVFRNGLSRGQSSSDDAILAGLGLLNHLLTAVGLEVAIVSVWKDAGFYMILLIAGLQIIDPGYYEAARVDGAKPFRRFYEITPSLLSRSLRVLRHLHAAGILRQPSQRIRRGRGDRRGAAVLQLLPGLTAIGAAKLISIFVIAFINNWDERLRPLLHLNSPELRTVSLDLMRFVGELETAWTLLMAGSVALTLPLILIYVLGQKYVLQEFAGGGVKG